MNDALQAEQRLARVSGEAAEAQAAAAATKAAGRELKEKVAAAAREAGLRKDEVSRLKGELERSRAACAEKVIKSAAKCYCTKVLVHREVLLPAFFASVFHVCCLGT